MRHSFNLALAAIVATASAASHAAVVTVAAGTNFASTPFTQDFGGGNSLTFTLVDPAFFAYDPAGVSTAGSTQVLSLGAPFYDPPRPTSFFTDRGGSIGPASLGTFTSFATPAAIPFSIVRSLVGFRFDLGGGYQYGFADVTGGRLAGIRFETTPGVAIGLNAVPEPASWALLIAGFGLVGGAARRRRHIASAG